MPLSQPILLCKSGEIDFRRPAEQKHYAMRRAGEAGGDRALLQREQHRCSGLAQRLEEVKAAFMEAVRSLSADIRLLHEEREALRAKLRMQAETIHLLTCEQDQQAS